MIKRNDIIIIICVILFCALSFVGVFAFRRTPAKVIISEKNEVLYSVSLYSDREIALEHNTIVIRGGKVYMKSADCKNQICVNTPSIQKDSEQIICLPNQVLVEVSE